MSFFRDEALEYRKKTNKNNIYIKLDTPIYYNLFSLASVVILITLVAMLFIVDYSRRAKAAGKIVPESNLVRVVSFQNGVVLKSMAHEGKLVNKGDVLFVINSERNGVNGSIESHQISNLKLDLENSKAQKKVIEQISESQLNQKDSEINSLISQINLINGQIDIEKQRVAIAEDSFKKYDELSKVGYVSQAQFLSKKDELFSQKSRLEQFTRDRESMLGNLKSLKSQKRSMQEQLALEQSKLKTSESGIVKELEETYARKEQTIVAPSSGMLTAVQAFPGQAISSGTPLAGLIPKNSRLIAKVSVPSSAMGFIHSGQKVLVHYAAYPYQKFGSYNGVIFSISEASMVKKDEKVNDNFYEISINLESQFVDVYGGKIKIKPDMSIDVDIITEKRKLIEWILEPFFAAGRN